MQRYISQLPAAGEIVIFDRSWYNRAGVERVMGFTPEAEGQGFPRKPAAARKLARRLGRSCCGSTSSMSARKSRSAASCNGSTIRCGNGSSARWTSNSYRKWWDYSRAYAEMIRGDRHRRRALVGHRLERQEAGPDQRDHASAGVDPLRAREVRQAQAGQTAGQAEALSAETLPFPQRGAGCHRRDASRPKAKSNPEELAENDQ